MPSITRMRLSSNAKFSKYLILHFTVFIRMKSKFSQHIFSTKEGAQHHGLFSPLVFCSQTLKSLPRCRNHFTTFARHRSASLPWCRGATNPPMRGPKAQIRLWWNFFCRWPSDEADGDNTKIALGCCAGEDRTATTQRLRWEVGVKFGRTCKIRTYLRVLLELYF
jgi:hypothetical protein